ncbi:hypothetical protein TNCT_195701 [Trichonephila clavata]|uniref:Uncharacterized protein n=1 Tax=Trichonephila clavata TaxID=2740835 RepID=A0A8X6GFV2_TRICU|nr:hypothetical protein TNCT_195701 [Trichonephila clavata]
MGKSSALENNNRKKKLHRNQRKKKISLSPNDLLFQQLFFFYIFTQFYFRELCLSLRRLTDKIANAITTEAPFHTKNSLLYQKDCLLQLSKEESESE